MKKGFTLIELLAVIAIIGILFAMLLSAINCETECNNKENNTQSEECYKLNGKEICSHL